jgi:pyruvate,orthophosphate dikinase
MSADGLFAPKLASSYDLEYRSVISFGTGHSSPFDAGKEMKFLLGGKGANLGKMSDMGLSVPPGFTITTEVCSAFQNAGRMLSADVWSEVQAALKQLEVSFLHLPFS